MVECTIHGGVVVGSNPAGLKFRYVFLVSSSLKQR
jgi:hypothetical protein